MASVDQKLHDKIAAGLADQRVSPAILALKMTRENRHVNEAMLGYLVSYIIFMADQEMVPMPLAEIHQTCKQLRYSLEELGLTGIVRKDEPMNEFLLT
jgi:hypothetical protein